MNPWQPERDIWAEVRAAAHVPEERPRQRRRQPHPRLQRLAVSASSAGVVIMLGLLAAVVILAVVVVATRL